MRPANLIQPIKHNWTLFLYFLSVGLLLSIQLFYSLKADFDWFHYLLLALFNIWIVFIGFWDCKNKTIPLWLTGPVMLLVLSFHLLFPEGSNVFSAAVGSFLGFKISALDSAFGLCLGFMVLDIVTHFGNWMSRFPQSSQGLFPLWLAMPILFLNLFVDKLILWQLFFVLVVVRLLFQFLYVKSPKFCKTLEWLCLNPALTYSLIFLLLITVGYSYQVGSRLHLSLSQLNNFIFILAAAFILEEVLIPFIFFVLEKLWLKNKNSDELDDDRQSLNVLNVKPEGQSILGGGDVTFAASIGCLWGAVVVNNFLLVTFLLAFLLIAIYKGYLKVVSVMQKQSNPLIASSEIPFAPFMVLCAQIVMINNILLYL
ncbi:MAG TPA: hypothetical protein V6C96_02475 [Vampirovibrionales bacterium]